MIKIIYDTFTDAGAFWAAASCCVTSIGITLLFYQLGQIRKGIASQKVEALEFIREQLQSSDFMMWCRNLRSYWDMQEEDYVSDFDNDVHSILARLDFVARMIKIDYLDKDLFFYIFGDDLRNVKSHLDFLEHQKRSRVYIFKNANMEGYSLLNEASEYASKEKAKALKRLTSR